MSILYRTLPIFCCAWLLLPLAAAAESVRGASPPWGLYDELLAAHLVRGERDGVRAALVNYTELAADPRFEELVGQLQRYPQERLTTRDEQIAFFSNAYNILTLKVVADHWPVASIRDIGNFFEGPWDIKVLQVAGEWKSLDDIEHRILRPMGEPRVHFALNCASLSCPDLRPEAYRAKRLDAQLTDQTKLFLADPKALLVEDGTARVSRIFDWYDEDFTGEGGVVDVAGFVRRYGPELPEEIRVEANLPYNWSINSF